MISNREVLKRLGYLALIGLVGLLVAQPAAACSVCYGAPDSAMVKGMNNGIMVLLGVVGFVQIGLVALFLAIRHRMRELDRRKSQFQVLQGGVG